MADWRDVLGIGLTVLIVGGGLLSLLASRKPRIERAVKGLHLTQSEWQLLGSLAVFRRTNQVNLVTQIVKEYLQKHRV